MDNDICDAWLLASQLHKDQRRKYTGNHYIDHLAEVAALTQIFTNGHTDAIIAAWLHDCIEDQNYPLQLIADEFGIIAASYVYDLTEQRPEGCNRKKRHQLYNIQLGEASKNVQCIKAADIISNIKGVVEHDVKFGEVYLAEKTETLSHLTKLDSDVRLAVKVALSDAGKILDTKRVQDWLEQKERK